METLPRIICIGLANVDVIAHVSDEFLSGHGMTKGAANGLDACHTGTILAQLRSPICCPGGAAANTACGLSEFGIPAQFIGKCGDDGYADIFGGGFSDTKVVFDTKPYAQKMTSVCLTLLTPDKDRTFAFCADTAGWYINPDDLPDPVQDGWIYAEGNTGLISIGGGRVLLEDIAKRYADMNLIVNLGDSTVVNGCRAVIGSLMARPAQTIFVGNIGEVETLFQTDDFYAICARIKATGKTFAITRGAKGACIVKDGQVHYMDAEVIPNSSIVNTVGAGDQFAAGFLAGLVAGMDIEAAAAQGIKAATTVLKQLDARPKHGRRIA